MNILLRDKHILALIILASLVMIVSAFFVGSLVFHLNLFSPASAHPTIAGGFCC